jgi:methionyl-tRNA formyltransferase
MSFVLLTHGSEHAERVLLALAAREVVPDAILIARPAPATRGDEPERSRRAALAGLLARLGGGRVIPEQNWVSRLTGFAPRVQSVGRIDFAPVTVALRELAPEWLLLADSGIVSPAVLAVPRRGTLNGHPALLPWVRGVSVIEHSILRGVAPGATVHLVDAGIDTGPVVRRVLVPVTPHDTLDTLWRKSMARSAELVAEVVAAIARGREAATRPQSRKVPYCGWATPEERRRATEAIVGGAAHRLFEEWRAFFGGDELPLDDERLPDTLCPPA